jgi:lipopolysaccharide export LptBFGC system permease protein LptF
MRVNFKLLLNTGFVSSAAAGFSGRGAKPVVFMLGLFLFGAAFLPAQSAAQSAEAIVDSARNRIGAETVTSRSRMVLTDKKGGTSERIIDQFSKKNADGDRTLIVFQRPASIAGTRFLTIENNDKWIFLPNLGRVRRIAAAEGSGSFMGTDMSYDDIASASRDVSLDTHTLLREETVNGQQMYVIESVPKDKGYQYSKMVQWIGKTDKITHKIELYNKRGALHKVLEVLTVKTIQNYETPVVTRMTTVPAGTSTTINVDTLKYDDPMPDGIFSQSYLETGRL